MAHTTDHADHDQRIKNLVGDVRKSFEVLPLSEEAVLKLVKQYQHISFVELQRRFSGARGDVAMASQKNPRLIFWVGLSEELFNIIVALQDKKKLFIHPAHWLVYAADGGMLDVPLYKGGTPTKNERWVPITFCTYPNPEMKKLHEKRKGKPKCRPSQ